MRTKIVAFVLVFLSVLCLSSCKKEEQNERFVEGSIEITAENHPKIAVTKMNSDIAVNLVSAVLGCNAEQAEDFIIVCETADECYLMLASAGCDLVIADEPSKEKAEALTQNGVSVESSVIAVDALVFITSEGNAVSGLTTAQIKDIYSFEITDWTAVGGTEGEIRAFKANENTVTGQIFNRLIGVDTSKLKVPVKTVQTANGILVADKEYDNSATSIGYSMYRETLRPSAAKNGQFKLLAVDGIYPEASKIQSGEYPLCCNIHLAVSGSLPSDSVAKLYYDWILSEQGVKIVGGSGVILPSGR